MLLGAACGALYLLALHALTGPRISAWAVSLPVILATSLVGLAAAPAAWLERLHPAGVRRWRLGPTLLVLVFSWVAVAALEHQARLVADGLKQRQLPLQLLASSVPPLEVALEALPHALALTVLCQLRWRRSPLVVLVVLPAGVAFFTALWVGSVGAFFLLEVGQVSAIAPGFGLAAWVADRLEGRGGSAASALRAAAGTNWGGFLFLAAFLGALYGLRDIAALHAQSEGSSTTFAATVCALYLYLVALVARAGQRLRRHLRTTFGRVAFVPVPDSLPDWAVVAGRDEMQSELAAQGFAHAADRLVQLDCAPYALGRLMLHPQRVVAWIWLSRSEDGSAASLDVGLCSDFAAHRRLLTTNRPLDASTWALLGDHAVVEAVPHSSPASLLQRHLAARARLVPRWGEPLSQSAAEALEREVQQVSLLLARLERAWTVPLGARFVAFGEPARAGRWPGPVPPVSVATESEGDGRSPATPAPQPRR